MSCAVPAAQQPPRAPASLEHLGLTWFIPVMGLSGLSLAWRQAAPLFGDGGLLASQLIGAFAALWFVVLLGLTVVRVLRWPHLAHHKWMHPVRYVFIATIPVSMILLATVGVSLTGVAPHWNLLWQIGAAAQAALTVAVLVRWVRMHTARWVGVLNENTDKEKALWPEFFDLEALRRTRSTMPAYQWNAQYQQNPTGDTSSICKREWWRTWPEEEPPQCEYLIQCIDAAAELNNRSDYTSITTWGVFLNEETGLHNIILLNSVRARMEFHQLKERVLEEYNYWEPDSCLVEKKSSGTALYQELRRMGVPVGEYTPHRGTINNPNNKYMRLNAVTDMIREGLVWVPQTRWAEQLVEEVAEFPYGDHDDTVDTTIMALTRFRQGGFVQLSTDHKDEPRMFRRRNGYY